MLSETVIDSLTHLNKEELSANQYVWLRLKCCRWIYLACKTEDQRHLHSCFNISRSDNLTSLKGNLTYQTDIPTEPWPSVRPVIQEGVACCHANNTVFHCPMANSFACQSVQSQLARRLNTMELVLIAVQCIPVDNVPF